MGPEENTPQSYAERWKAQADQSKQQHEGGRRYPEAAERRAEKVAQVWGKGVDFFKTGFNAVREKVNSAKTWVKDKVDHVGDYAKEAGKFVLASPEWLADRVDDISDAVKEKVAKAALGIDRVNDWCADRWEGATAKVTGAVESSFLKARAMTHDADARIFDFFKKRSETRLEKGHSLLKGSLEAAKNLVKYLESKLESAESGDRQNIEFYGQQLDGAKEGAAEFRQEAEQRKDNGKMLANFREKVAAGMAPTRFP